MAHPLIPDAQTAAEAWAERVRKNREQVERFREVPDGADFYAPVAAAFRDDPDRTGDSVLNAVLELVVPGETWLDIGAGGGRYGLPIARKAGEVIGIDPSEGMLDVFRQGAKEHGITNVHLINDRWPMESPPEADVALIANVGMDIEDFAGFLDAMENAARRLCVTVMGHRQATIVFDKLWPRIHGENRAALPALPEFLALLLARERLFEVRLATRPPMAHGAIDDILSFVRRQTWVAPGTEKDVRLRQLIEETVIERDGRFAFSWDPVVAAVVSWAPPKAQSS